MRILHWYPNFFAGGGVANAVLGLAASQARLGADVTVAAAEPSGRPLYEPMGDGSFPVIAWRPRWRLQVAGTLARVVPGDAVRRLRAFRPDLTHVHGGFNPDNLWVPALFGSPVVFSPHGTFHPEVFVKSRRVTKRLYFGLERHALYRRVVAFHALCPAEQQHIERLLPGARVYCVPQGPNIRTQLSPVEASRGVSAGGVKFVFVGRLDVFTKGLDILLEAFALAMGRLDARAVTLTLVGPSWKGSDAWLRHRAHALGIGQRVILTGALPSHDVAGTLRQSDVSIQLSRHDGFPLSVVEALLAGKPVIVSKAVGVVSYPEVAALPHIRVIPPDVTQAADAIVECARDLDGVRASADRHRAWVHEFFSWERVARLQLEAYTTFVDRARGRQPVAAHTSAG